MYIYAQEEGVEAGRQTDETIKKDSTDQEQITVAKMHDPVVQHLNLSSYRIHITLTMHPQNCPILIRSLLFYANLHTLFLDICHSIYIYTNIYIIHISIIL